MRVRLLGFLARRSLFSDRLTVVLLALAIAVGAGFQIANSANLEAFAGALLDEGLTRGAGDIRVEPDDTARFRDGDAMAATLRKFPHVTDAQAILVYAGAVRKQSRPFFGAPIYGLVPTATPPYHVVEGTGLRTDDPTGILLGTSLAKRLGAKIGDPVDVRVIFGAAGLAIDDDNTGRFTLTLRGIVAGSAGAYRFAFVDRNFIAKESGEPKAASAILVYVDDHEAATRIAADINASDKTLAAVGWREDDPYLPNYLSANRAIAKVSYAMVIAAVSVPMWALLYIHVLKRRREIGILGALGFRRGEIFAIYLIQAIVVAVIGCVVGCGIGYVLIRYFHANPVFAWDSLVVQPIPTLAAFAVPMITITITAIIAGTYPAWRAARTDPAKVLRGLE